jgi:hypothetical protein
MTELEARRHINDLVASRRITLRDSVALLGLRHELHRRRQSRLVRFLRAVMYVFAHDGQVTDAP